MNIDSKKGIKIHPKKNDEKLLDKNRDKSSKISVGTIGPSTSTSPKVASKKKVSKNGKARDSGTSSEEERWLDAIESGKLEEVIYFHKYLHIIN